MNILHCFLDVLIGLSHSCTEVSCDSLLLCHLLNHLINLIRCSIHIIFSITTMAMNIDKSRNHHRSSTVHLKIIFFRLKSCHISDFFNLLIEADITIFNHTIPCIDLLFFDQFHAVLPRFLFFRTQLLLFYYLTIPRDIPSIFRDFYIIC